MKKTLWLCALAGSLPLFAEGFAQPKFVPDISLITDFSYVSRNKEAHEMEGWAMPGLSHDHGDEHDHEHASPNANEGFNLNYAELGISAAADPYFDLNAIFHLSEAGFEIEEAYAVTRALPAGMGLKAGKFLSGFGRHNEQHHHAWAFGDAPLVYNAFLGDHGLNEKGVQLSYVPALPHYLKVGIELLQGENENSFGISEVVLDDGTDEKELEGATAPSLWVAYVKGAWDIKGNTLMLGLSHASGKTHQDHDDHALIGETDLSGLDVTLHLPLSAYSNVVWQSEYLTRIQEGDRHTAAAQASLKKEQAGFYTQLLWRLSPRWRTGVRLDSITQNDVMMGGNNTGQPDDLQKTALMAEYNPSEFSRLRLQFNRDESLYEGAAQQSVNTVMLQFNLSIGAHGAHAF